MDLIPEEATTSQFLQRLLDIVVLFLGVWSLYCYLLVGAGASYGFLFSTAWLPVVIAAWTFCRASKRQDLPGETAGIQPIPRRQFVFGIAAAAGVAVAYHVSSSYVVFWVTAVVVMVVGFRLAVRHEPPSAVPPEKVGMVVFLCLLSLAVTLLAHRPDLDDSFYLGLVTGSLDHPERPILRHDTTYGEADLPLIEPAYRLKTYELLVATLTDWSGVQFKLTYYLLFPALFAVLAVGAYWLVLREIGGSFAWVGCTVAVLVLIFWGDGNGTFGNFAFVRLFQGKAVLVSFFVPAAVLYASRFARNRTVYDWVLLACLQIGALGVSPSAVVAVPVTSAVVLLAAAPEKRSPRLMISGILSSAFVVAAVAGVLTEMAGEREMPTSEIGFQHLTDTTHAGLLFVLGHPCRSTMALTALILLPLWASDDRRGRILRRFVLIMVLVIMNPLLPGALGTLAFRLSWRVFWAVPFPLLIGLLAQRIAQGSRFRSASLTGAFSIAVLFAMLPGAWTVSRENRTTFSLPGYKVGPKHAVARSVVDLTNPEDLVLAPFALSRWIPTFRLHPRLVIVRPNYLHKPAVVGWKEVEERVLLSKLVSGPKLSPADRKRAFEVMKTRHVTVVVMPSGLARRRHLDSTLEELGCRPLSLPAAGGVLQYSAWRCSEA